MLKRTYLLTMRENGEDKDRMMVDATCEFDSALGLWKVTDAQGNTVMADTVLGGALMLLDFGLNAFGLQLFIESYTDHENPPSLSFRYLGVNISISVSEDKPVTQDAQDGVVSG